MSRTRLSLGLALASLVLHGCASVPEDRRDPRDPFERYNRAVYQLNDELDRGIARPFARGYTKITPDPVETGISNFFENLTYPNTIVNDALQLKPKAFVQATARLVVNTTIGIGGLFDPATQLGIPTGDEDFGQTLGRWGVPPGPYIMMPIFGPYSARDAFGDLADQYANPRAYIDDPWLRYGLWGLEQIEQRASLLGTDEVLQRAYDPYAFIRNAYFERRKFQVSDGEAPPEELEIFEEEPPAN